MGYTQAKRTKPHAASGLYKVRFRIGGQDFTAPVYLKDARDAITLRNEMFAASPAITLCWITVDNFVKGRFLVRKDAAGNPVPGVRPGYIACTSCGQPAIWGASLTRESGENVTAYVCDTHLRWVCNTINAQHWHL